METGQRHDMAWRAAHASAWRAYRGWRGENWDEREAVAAAAAAAVGTYWDLMSVLPPEPEPLHEWPCPSCGAVTRARMAD